jgi:hypothetical protein
MYSTPHHVKEGENKLNTHGDSELQITTRQ